MIIAASGLAIPIKYQPLQSEHKSCNGTRHKRYKQNSMPNRYGLSHVDSSYISIAGATPNANKSDKSHIAPQKHFWAPIALATRPSNPSNIARKMA